MSRSRSGSLGSVWNCPSCPPRATRTSPPHGRVSFGSSPARRRSWPARCRHPGRLGELSVDEGRQAARIAALNLLATIETELGLENVVRVLKITGFVASADGFVEQPEVVNAASELLVDILGDAGRHARSAIGVAWLPGNAAVEIEAIVSGATKETT